MKKSPPKIPRNDFDSPWKEVLMIFFQDFMEFCFPTIAKKLDWSRGYTFLDKELRAITRVGVAGRRIADKLIKVYEKDGSEIWLLIHVEIQAQKIADFPERMYIYQYRIFDRFRVPVVSVAILVDGHKNWRPTIYEIIHCDTELRFKYNVLKVLDYDDRRDLLEKSNNPFATVILAQLIALDLAKKCGSENKLVTKLALTRLLFAKNWRSEQMDQLFRFIDWLILLPAPLVIEYDAAIHELSEEMNMAYITSIERLAMKRGRERGMLEGRQEGKLAGMLEGMLEGKLEAKWETARAMLNEGMDEALIAKVTQLNLDEIRSEINKWTGSRKVTQH